MKRVIWLTDPHLNFLSLPEINVFLNRVADTQPDAVLLGGDIGEATDLAAYLELFDQRLACPVYFVLGNHDYYRGSLQQVERLAGLYAGQSKHLIYLPQAGVVELTPETALVGHGGWGDGRCGDYQNSWVILSDFLFIEELTGLSKAERLRRLHQLGDEAAVYVREALRRAFETHRRAILLTHVPPFREACWHQGRLSDDNFLPFFTCKAVGDALREIMQARLDRELLVLCGHTHGGGTAQILDNLRVLTGSAEYGAPEIQAIVKV